MDRILEVIRFFKLEQIQNSLEAE